MTKNKQYKSGSKRITEAVVVIGILVVLAAVAAFPNRASTASYVSSVAIFLGFWTTFLLAIKYLVYVTITLNELILTDIFTLNFKKAVSISRITRIRIGGMYRILGSIVKSVYIIYNDGGTERYLELRLTNFDDDTVRSIVHELLSKNPRIELNNEAEAFMSSI